MTVPRTASPAVNPYLGRMARILLVEDSPSDLALTVDVLRAGRILNEMHTVRDGEAAMRYLRGEGEYEGAALPDLIILDLNLPRMDGREVLAEVKRDPRLRAIPVVILTTSAAETDVVQTYNLQANAYITKPVGLEAFIAAVEGIEEFWLSLVRLPRK